MLWYSERWSLALHFSLSTWGLPLHIWWDEYYCHVGILCFYGMYYTKQWREDTYNGNTDSVE